MCVCFLMKHIAVYRKIVSSEIRYFLRGLFFASKPIGKLNFKLSIPVRKKRQIKTQGSIVQLLEGPQAKCCKLNVTG